MSESVKRSDQRVGQATPTHTRTHRQRYPITVDESLTAVDARCEDGFSTVGEVLDRGILLSEGRHPVVRTGEREPIPHHVRSAVWFRDRGRCELCGISERVEGAWHLDHITPWSAGGGDDTTNLRVLCEEHNIERSNHLDPTERTRMPATWWCDRCYGVERQPWDYTESGYIACPIHARSRRNACPVQRDYDWGRTRDDWEPWHQRRDVMDPTVVAYCAHCQMPGVTDVVL